MLEGGMGSQKMWQFVTGEGVKGMWHHAYKKFLSYETWNLKWCLTFCCNRCILTEGKKDKNHPGQIPPRTIEGMWHHAYTNFLSYETWNLKWCLTFCCNRCILTEGEKDKNHPGQIPPWTIERELVQGAFVQVFCTRPTKNRGDSEMCDVLWGSRDVWQSVTGGGGKIGQK